MTQSEQEHTPDGESEQAARSRVFWRRFMVAFFGLGTLAAGTGFCVKIYEFTGDLLAEEGIQFAGVHLLAYGMVAAGFLALLAFSFFSGHFADIEAPKYDLIEREREYDLRECA